MTPVQNEIEKRIKEIIKEIRMNQQVYEKLQYHQLITNLKSYCISNLGIHLVESLKPSGNMKVVENRLRETAEAKALLDITGSIPLQGITTILEIKEQLERDMILTEEQLSQVAEFLAGCRKMSTYMKDKEFTAPLLYNYSQGLESLLAVEDEIYDCIRNNQVRDEASKELKKIRRYIAVAEGKIEDRLNQFLKNGNNKPYIQEFFVTRRNGSLTIPIKASEKAKVKGTVIDSNGKTVFMEIESVSRYTAEVNSLKMDEITEVYIILSRLTGIVYDQLDSIKRNMDILAEFDFLIAKGKYSRAMNGIQPQLNDYGYIHIKEGKHPLLEGEVVPLTMEIGKKFRTLIITGPNAGGKTVVLKTVGLLTLAMQIGLHIPVGKESNLSVFDRVFVDIGDNQSMENSLSTFSSHVQNLAQIAKATTKSTLLLFDEVGSGTEPSEGAALAIAVLESLYHKGAITIATTHYNEIKDFSAKHPDFENAAMKFNSETLEPLYQLSIGKSGESNALWIARKMGIDTGILETANAYLEHKNYKYDYVDAHKKRTRKETTNQDAQKVVLVPGDKVLLLEHNIEALVYEPKTKLAPLRVFYNNQIVEVEEKRVRLLLSAKELYPEGYNLDLIFQGFQKLKEEHDITRGSKKALKKIQKEMKKK